MALTSIFLVKRTCLNFLIYKCKSKFCFSSLSISTVVFLHFPQRAVCSTVLMLFPLFGKLIVLLILMPLNSRFDPKSVFFCFDSALRWLWYIDLCWIVFWFFKPIAVYGFWYFFFYSLYLSIFPLSFLNMYTEYSLVKPGLPLKSKETIV